MTDGPTRRCSRRAAIADATRRGVWAVHGAVNVRINHTAAAEINAQLGNGAVHRLPRRHAAGAQAACRLRCASTRRISAAKAGKVGTRRYR